MEIKIQVLAIDPTETRKNFQGTGLVKQRALQCFIDGKVAVHTLREDDTETNAEAIKKLENLEAGFYMASLTPRAGNYGRLEFTIGKLQHVNEIKKAA